MRTFGLGLALLVLVSAVSGCGHSSSPTEPGGGMDSIALESISPPVTTPLTTGSEVTFTGRVRYNLASASSGSIFIVIEDQSAINISPTVPQPSLSISRGSGTVEISDHIRIPAGVTKVNVFFPVVPSGATRSTAVTSVAYTVN